MKIAAVLAVSLLLAGCSSSPDGDSSSSAPLTKVRLATLDVRVCYETCALTAPDIGVFVDSPNMASLQVVTDATGHVKVDVPVPGTYSVEALGPKGWTMEQGTSIILDGNATHGMLQVVLYKDSLTLRGSAPWGGMSVQPQGGRLDLPLRFNENTTVERAYQSRLAEAGFRITWNNTLTEFLDLASCLGTSSQPGTVEGSASNATPGPREHSSTLLASPTQIAAIQSDLLMGANLQGCAKSNGLSTTVNAVEVHFEASFAFQGRSTRNFIR